MLEFSKRGLLTKAEDVRLLADGQKVLAPVLTEREELQPEAALSRLNLKFLFLQTNGIRVAMILVLLRREHQFTAMTYIKVQLVNFTPDDFVHDATKAVHLL